MQYRFVKPYRSDFGTYAAGDVIEFDPDTAAWLLRDEPGCIEPVESRAIEAAPHDRQMKSAPKKRGGSAMSIKDSSGFTKGGT